jgi:uncharacterized repeat protein (TIGR03803 family)
LGVTATQGSKQRHPQQFFMRTFRWNASCVALAVFLFTIVGFVADAQTNFTALKRLTSPTGVVPYGRLTVGPDGALYGTTVGGGISNAGTVFRMAPDGSAFSVLKSFVGTDGGSPETGLALAADGILVGTTYGGGISNYGTIFKIAINGTGFQVLHYFTGGADCKNPTSDPIIGSDGAIYGVTYYSDGATRGTIYKINPGGDAYSVIHTFTGTPDGQQPIARLLQAADGMLYGTTMFGGVSSQLGAIFSLNLDGSSYSVIHALQSSSGEGRGPQAGLCQSANGMLYGTTYSGGSAGAGVIFQVDTSGNYSIVRSFQTTGGDGQHPDTDLIEAPDGFLYGGTYAGGAGGGTLFKIMNDGSGYTVLRSFSSSGNDFNTPNDMFQQANGVFYGTMQHGGGGSGGCIFALTDLPLPPRVTSLSTYPNSNFVQFSSTSGVLYDVQRSTNLVTWSLLTTSSAPVNGILTYSDSNPPASRAFYRLHQQ